MPRKARVVIAGVPHHITQRGNNRQDVFLHDKDRQAYLEILAEECRRYRVAVLGYCLMRNHVHLVLLPQTVGGLARALGRTHWKYSQHFNRTHKRSGHVWQNRFFSCPLGHDHFWAAVRYVERNPVRAGICRAATEYRWSSAAMHCGGKDELKLLDLKTWRRWCAEGGWTVRTWPRMLEEPDQEVEIATIRRATRTGRPWAEGSSLRSMERKAGCPLTARQPGRPKGAKTKRVKGK
jgi:putative transposase